ncbi:hypothetical protein [Pseudoalteromonas sp. SG45-1]|uniref:hypothetical protein n=1 Tax=Pseudoalteromonas sp. SG45-1 TaxID=2760957 RepID=UPI0016046380|nr:hypothetical protein [Pseudoalteromonas sp. SG45-1]MBB1403884.1 hypothetical protein [Pseudoalteromonas sp. SG45-1]
MTNLFGISIKSNETNSFFRGEKNYFVRTPGFDQHNHGANLSGHVESFINCGDDNAEIFDEAFINFLGSLEVNQEDLTHFMSNVSAFFALTHRGKLKRSRLFRYYRNSESFLINHYLKKVSNSELYSSEKDRIYKHADFISKNGNVILLNALKEIEAKR